MFCNSGSVGMSGPSLMDRVLQVNGHFLQCTAANRGRCVQHCCNFFFKHVVMIRSFLFPMCFCSLSLWICMHTSCLHSTYQFTSTCHRCTNAFALAQVTPQKQSCICHGSGGLLSDVTGGNARKSAWPSTRPRPQQQLQLLQIR